MRTLFKTDEISADTSRMYGAEMLAKHVIIAREEALHGEINAINAEAEARVAALRAELDSLDSRYRASREQAWSNSTQPRDPSEYQPQSPSE
jgi:hypothetical protein